MRPRAKQLLRRIIKEEVRKVLKEAPQQGESLEKRIKATVKKYKPELLKLFKAYKSPVGGRGEADDLYSMLSNVAIEAGLDPEITTIARRTWEGEYFEEGYTPAESVRMFQEELLYMADEGREGEGERLEDYGITRYKKNPDGTVDVMQDVNLAAEELKKIPFKFGKVTGDFNCSENKITSLEGAPREVTGRFYCYDNRLTSLKGGPSIVGGIYHCPHNRLTTLEGAPEKVGGDFWCNDNKLTSLKGAPKEVAGDFVCNSNPKKFTERQVRSVVKVGGEIW